MQELKRTVSLAVHTPVISVCLEVVFGEKDFDVVCLALSSSYAAHHLRIPTSGPAPPLFPQKLQYPLSKEYTLTYSRIPHII